MLSRYFHSSQAGIRDERDFGLETETETRVVSVSVSSFETKRIKSQSQSQNLRLISKVSVSDLRPESKSRVLRLVSLITEFLILDSINGVQLK